jgi:glycosyltransferase involved in cell wall biosynthesis
LKQKREKILVLTHNFPRAKEDSPGLYIFLLMKELIRDYDIFVLAPHQKGFTTYEEMDGIKIYRFRYNFASFESLAYRGDMHERILRSFRGKISFLFFILSYFFYGLWIVKKNKIKLVHCHWWVPCGMVGYLLSFFAPLQMVITTHGSDVFILRRFRQALPLAKLIFRKAQFITAVSSSLKQLISLELGIDRNKIFVFPMPFDPNKFYTQKERKIKQGTILSIGRLIQRKGYDYLIKSARILKDQGVPFELTIIGKGPEEENLRNLISELDLERNVNLLDWLPQKELNTYYNRSEIFVLSSVTDWKKESEGLGLVLLEAMACKVPVVATSSGGPVDIVLHERTGLLVLERDSEALATALKRLLEDRSLGEKLAEEGYKLVYENFTPQATALKLKAIYQKMG